MNKLNHKKAMVLYQILLISNDRAVFSESIKLKVESFLIDVFKVYESSIINFRIDRLEKLLLEN